MKSTDRALRFVALFLRGLLVLNVVALLAFLAGLSASWVFEPVLAARLAHKYGASLNVTQAVAVLRFLLLLGIASAVAVHALLTSLIRIVSSVGKGDPFTETNATLLVRIGWALLALQVLDLCFGLTGRWVTMLKLDCTGWTPSVGGWIAVVMVFVLARVFRIGAGMRDDLAATI